MSKRRAAVTSKRRAGKKPSPRQKLYRLQRRIFRSLEAESGQLLGETPAAIRQYARENALDFRAASATPVTKDQIVAAIRGADASFIADFHTFGQSQRTALRLIRDAVGPDLPAAGRGGRRPGPEWLIGLELIPSQYQSALDAYQAGRISLENFHRIIRYQEHWGFPWKNYAPIFEWARLHGVRLIALNRPQELIYARAWRKPARADAADLHARDEWAAGLITDLFAECPRRRMIVLYGELHVGTRHLPAQVARISRAFTGRALRTVSIHQNNDALYWELARGGLELQTEGVRLGRAAFCAFSSTPWARLQSLINWLEGENLEEPEEYSGTDPVSLMRVYAGIVAEFLGVEAPPFDSLGVRTIEEADFVHSLEDSGVPADEIRLIRYHVMSNHRIYVPALQACYLGTPSQNSAAEMAALHLLKHSTRTKALFKRTQDDFYRLVLEAAFAFFGSLILNPRRKCDLPADHARRLQALESGERPAFPLEAHARRLTAAVLASARRAEPPAALAQLLANPKLAPAAMVAARQVGQILGKRLHKAVLAETVSVAAVRTLFLERARGSTGASHFDRYQRLLVLTARARVEPTKSQTL